LAHLDLPHRKWLHSLEECVPLHENFAEYYLIPKNKAHSFSEVKQNKIDQVCRKQSSTTKIPNQCR
jgi:hypothetical protein